MPGWQRCQWRPSGIQAAVFHRAVGIIVVAVRGNAGGDAGGCCHGAAPPLSRRDLLRAGGGLALVGCRLGRGGGRCWRCLWREGR